MEEKMENCRETQNPSILLNRNGRTDKHKSEANNLLDGWNERS